MAKPKKDTTEERKENLKKKIEQARKASPSGTLGGATGKAGAKGSRQTRTGISLSDPTGGTTIVVREDTRKAEVVPTKAIQKGKVVKGTTSQEFQAKIYRSRGYVVESSATGLKATKPGARTVYISSGRERRIAEVFAFAKVNVNRIPSRRRQAVARFVHGMKSLRDADLNNQEPRNIKYYTGPIPHKDTKVKQYGELTQEQKGALLGPPPAVTGFRKGVGTGKRHTYWKFGPSFRGEVGREMAPLIGKKVSQVAGKTVSLYRKTDVFLKEKAAKYIPEKWERKIYLYSEIAKGMPKTTLGQIAEPKFAKMASGIVGGIRKEPTKTAAYTAALFALPPVMKGAGKVVGPVAAKFPKISGFLGKTVSRGLPILYGASVTEKLRKSKDPWVTFGEISGTEIGPMIIGGTAGAWFWPKASGYVRTWGRKKVPEENIIRTQLRMGKETFQTSSKPHKTFFKESPYQLHDDKLGVWHAGKTTKQTAFSDIIKYGSGEVGMGKEYLPGGFVAPSLSAHFLGVGGSKYSLYGGSFFSSYGSPTALHIYPKGIRKAPGRTPGKVWSFLTGKAEKGYAYTHTPSFKTEVEALIPPGTELKKVAGDFYVNWRGVRVPIDEFGVMGAGSKVGGKTFGLLSASSSFASSYPITTPASFAALLSSQLSYRKSSMPGSYYAKSSSRISKSSYSSISKLSSSWISKQSGTSKSRSSRYTSSKLSSLVSSKSVYSSSSVSKLPKSKSILSTISRSSVSKTVKSRYTPTPWTPPPPPPPFIFKPSRHRARKPKKQIKIPKLVGQYKPQIRAVYEDIWRKKKPSLLTGIGFERPRIRKRRGKK